jgi:hypothetical protein
MFKRILLTLTFVAAFSTIGIGVPTRPKPAAATTMAVRTAAYYARSVYYGPP